ncbi:MAG: tetratricopeptide repeat protein [Sphingobacteriia bacterium]|nr:tetratricopeptide repeat protein [Sphingobacteriia bacterium]
MSTSTHSKRPNFSFEKDNNWKWASLGVAVLTFLLFKSALNFQFTNWDDEGYILLNPLLKLPFPSFYEHFTTYLMGNYHPLTTLSLHLDEILGKGKPMNFHLTSILFHSLNSFLIVWWIRPYVKSGWVAVGIGLLFSFHPQRVESVAWISERKDVLYTFFYLLGILSWRLQKSTPWAIIWVGLAFIAALLSKGMAVTFPILLAFEAYRDGSWKSIRTKLYLITFVLIAIGFGVIAVLAQQETESIKVSQTFPIYLRPVYALYALAQYFRQFWIPTGLSNFYPYPDYGDYILYAVAMGMLVFLGAVGLYFKKWSAEGLFLWVILILPVLQLLPVGEALWSDRYMYLAGIGLLLWVSQRIEKLPYRIGLPILGIWILVSGGFTWQRLPVWKTSLSLWNNMISEYPEKYFVAYNNRAIALQAAGKKQEALLDYTHAIELFPIYIDAYYNRGCLKSDLGDFVNAEKDFSRAIDLGGKKAVFWYNRGNVRAQTGKIKEAILDFKKALEINPTYFEACTNLGNAQAMTGDLSGAVNSFTLAIELDPLNAQAFHNRGLALNQLGDKQKAIQDMEQAIQIHLKKNDTISANNSKNNLIFIQQSN